MDRFHSNDVINQMSQIRCMLADIKKSGGRISGVRPVTAQAGSDDAKALAQAGYLPPPVAQITKRPMYQQQDRTVSFIQKAQRLPVQIIGLDWKGGS